MCGCRRAPVSAPPSLALIYPSNVRFVGILTPARLFGVVDGPSGRAGRPEQTRYFGIKVHLEIRTHPVGVSAH